MVNGFQELTKDKTQTMFCINLESTDPYFNLAVDEYLLKNRTDNFLVLGINDKSAILGKHQIAHRETDTKFISANNIPVIRRITGGGTVFHDTGNLNFSFILNSEAGKQVDFRKYTRPVLDFLSSIGINAKFEGKSDLKIGRYKISGNAEHVHHDRVLHHGTLLFDVNLDLMRDSIRKEKGRYLTRAVNSNPSPVINLKYVLKDVLKDILKDVLKDIDNADDLRSLMMQWFLKNYADSEVSSLSGDEIKKIKLLSEKKYKTWEWNYGYGPEYHFGNRIEFNGKEIILRLFVKDGIILECEMKGSDELSSVAGKLVGCRHMPEDIQQVFNIEEIIGQEFDIYELF